MAPWDLPLDPPLIYTGYVVQFYGTFSEKTLHMRKQSVVGLLLFPRGYRYSPAVSLLSCTEEPSLLMCLSSILAAMSKRLMPGDLRAATSPDQVELDEDWSHSLSIAVKRLPVVR